MDSRGVKETIILRDVESDEVYSILVTPDEAKSLGAEAVFTTDKIYEVKNDDNSVDKLHDAGSSDHSEEVAVFKWPHEATLLLIEQYNLRQKDFTGGKISQKRIWSLIAAEMRKQGYIVTGPQCLSKFFGLKRTYKGIKNSKRSKTGAPTWPYFSNMEDLLSSTPTLPLMTVSSTGKQFKAALNECSTSNVDSCMEDERPMNFFKWPHEAVLLLIDQYNLRQKDFASGKISQKKIWSSIAAEMRKQNYNVTGPQCLSKFFGLKRTYKGIKSNKRSRSGPSTWPYYSNMDDLLHSESYMSLLSSTGKKSKVSDCSSSSADSCLEEEKSMHKKPRQMSSSLERLIKDLKDERKIAEAAEERRHKENVELRQRLLNSFEKMLEILQKK